MRPLMPELPEVEVAARHLAAWARGRKIVGGPPEVKGRTIQQVTRRGKWILCRLSGGAGLALHLGMTGKIVRARRGEPDPRFTRVVFELSDGTRICFVDMRRFGRVLVRSSYEDLLAEPAIAQVGPDALTELDVKSLQASLAATSRTVKEALLDQRIAAGVGNIYATEALWRARIHPARKARDVAADRAAVARLLQGIRAALRHGLKEYAPVEVPRYVEEGGDNPFFVYDRAGEPCRRCGTILKKMTLGGRTTAFCPTCQPRR